MNRWIVLPILLAIACGTEPEVEVEVEVEPEDPTWVNFAEDFFLDYCVSCHSPEGQATADYQEYDVVTQRLDAIRCGVASKEQPNCEGEHPPGWFPIGDGPFPTKKERARLVQWAEGGGQFE